MTFRIVERESFHVVGIPQSSDAPGCFGDAWQQFELIKHTVANRVEENVGFGLQVYPPEGTTKGRFTYLACCEVRDLQSVPVRLFSATIPEAQYAVFTVTNWNATVGHAWGAAYKEILPKSDYKPYQPWDFERYDQRAFVETPAEQEIEIHIPVTRK